MTKHADRIRAVVALGLVFGAVALAAPLSGQEVDVRWQPFLGCWEPTGQGAEADLVCIQAAEEPGAVQIVTLSGAEVIGRELIRVDGRRHPVSRETCTGWEEGFFSSDDERIYVRASVSCEGGAVRETSGVLAMASPTEWLDIRTAGAPGRQVAWVQRYVPADPALAQAAGFEAATGVSHWSARVARMTASQPLDVDDVIEASALVSPEAVQALVAERADRFQLSASQLLRMADAGVSEQVIDVTVAVSYPQQFRLNAAGPEVATSALDRGSLRRRWVGGPGMGWYDYDPFYAPWGYRYGYYGYGYGYSPYAYGYGWGGGGYGYGGWGYGGTTPTVIVVDRVGSSGGNQGGRVVAGRGYSRGSSGGSGGQQGAPASAPSSSSGSAGASGTTSGGGSSTGRTAVPRGSGGGGG